jgi:hypothetical protein
VRGVAGAGAIADFAFNNSVLDIMRFKGGPEMLYSRNAITMYQKSIKYQIIYTIGISKPKKAAAHVADDYEVNL